MSQLLSVFGADTDDDNLPEPDPAFFAKEQELLADLAFFDRRFPHLSGYPLGFKMEVLDTLTRNSDESQDFQEIVVNELAEAFDDDADW